jgi:hypothetical protein
MIQAKEFRPKLTQPEVQTFKAVSRRGMTTAEIMRLIDVRKKWEAAELVKTRQDVEIALEGSKVRDYVERALAQQLERGVSGEGGSSEASVCSRYWGSRFGTYCWRGYIQQGVEGIGVKAR